MSAEGRRVMEGSSWDGCGGVLRTGRLRRFWQDCGGVGRSEWVPDVLGGVGRGVEE